MNSARIRFDRLILNIININKSCRKYAFTGLNMSRQINLLVLNMALFLLILVQFLAGIRLWLVRLWGWPDSDFLMNLHLIVGLSLIVLVTVHLYMNRGWIRMQLLGPAKKRK